MAPISHSNTSGSLRTIGASTSVEKWSQFAKLFDANPRVVMSTRRAVRRIRGRGGAGRRPQLLRGVRRKGSNRVLLQGGVLQGGVLQGGLLQGRFNVVNVGAGRAGVLRCFGENVRAARAPADPNIFSRSAFDSVVGFEIGDK